MSWLGGSIKPSRSARALLACLIVLCSICTMLRMKILFCLQLLDVSGNGTNCCCVITVMGRRLFFSRINIINKIQHSSVSFSSKWEGEEVGRLLLLGKIMICGKPFHLMRILSLSYIFLIYIYTRILSYDMLQCDTSPDWCVVPGYPDSARKLPHKGDFLSLHAFDMCPLSNPTFSPTPNMEHNFRDVLTPQAMTTVAFWALVYFQPASAELLISTISD